METDGTLFHLLSLARANSARATRHNRHDIVISSPLMHLWWWSVLYLMFRSDRKQASFGQRA